MSSSKLMTPGVYINETDAFTNSFVPVPTAVPAFIGYTPQASYQGKSYANTAQKITSFAEFQDIYCLPDKDNKKTKQYSPQYYLVQQKDQPVNTNFLTIEGLYYVVLPDPNTIYYLYNSIKLFFQNGGGDAYIISVGSYGAPSGNPITPGNQIINPNVKLDDLLTGLEVLRKEQEPTMYICPEATLLSVADNATLMQSMLLLNAEMQTAISIFDVIGGNKPDPVKYTNDIETFRNSTGSVGLNYGAAYYPFLNTMVVPQNDIDYTNLFGGDLLKLEPLLNTKNNPNVNVATIIQSILVPAAPVLTTAQYNNALINSSKTYATILNYALTEANILPPSAALAGIITTVDNTQGVWNAPANVTITNVVSLPINLSSAQQENLNLDAVSGKSVNAIRDFTGRGILVWGARTLDGNSQDWRYIQVRRMMIMVEQSCKKVLSAYMFQPNDNNTWITVTSAINNFLKNLWQQGGLIGAKPNDSFFVQCGLGTTMTAQDILNGCIKVQIGVAIVRPAEFIIISLDQQMQV
jgi:phage tail sheath protein FI